MPLVASIVAATLLADPKVTFNTLRDVKQDYYDINLSWPTLTPETSINKLANKKMRYSVLKNLSEFKKASQEFGEKPTSPWEHQVASTISYLSPTLISVIVDTYEYSGGAHPNSWSDTINIALINGKPRAITLKDVLNSSLTEQEFLNHFVLTNVSEQRLKRSEMTVDSLPSETNRKFIISKNGLTFPFDKYSVASYAEGEFLVKLKWTDISGLINSKIVPDAK